MQPIQIFRPGRHTAMNGMVLSFAEADLAAAAAAYDPAVHEAPIVVGHPRADAPAYGWVAGLATGAGGTLEAATRQVDPAFAELVRAGRFKHVSASFYLPDSPHNPKPGAYYLRHVGFLGAEPPAVKGLRPVEFAEAEGVVEFSDGWALGSIARMFRGLREWLITQAGQERADAVLPSYGIDALAEQAVAEQVALQVAPATEAPAYSEKDTKVDEEEAARVARSRATDEAELARREQELAQREAAFAERDRSHRAAEDAAWFDGLVREGRALPAQRGRVLALLDRVDATEAVAFGEGEPTTARDALRSVLAGYPKVVEFRELAPNEAGTPLAEDATAEDIARASVAYQEEMRGKGITVSNIEAIAHVTGKGQK
jgi:hypothetical protein